MLGPVGPCANNGIIIGAENIMLDLKGFTVSGTVNSGDSAGLLMQGKSRVTVKNGRVTQFDGGVVIQNGGNNLVTNVVAEDNVGASQGHPPAPSTLYGDGIAIEGSSNNTVRFNTARRNGPYSGIG
ncbi:MAG: right-handed parallel beta-helix repeat-containing protein, partial [Acidimicrobiales bacterium]